jgi:vacuolar-type H+-ATPase subunit I/STV1
MGFFKESGSTTSSKSIARLQQLIWILIYGGLLTLVLGLSVQRMDAALGWSMVVGGGVVAAIGFVLIYVRSRLTSSD